jgi:aspartate carbamoyltransferase catalytic subunit
MMHHIVESQQFNRKSIGDIFALADTLEHTRDQSLTGKIMASLFL